MIWDAHTHFFSRGFFEFFARQVGAMRGTDLTPEEMVRETDLQVPENTAALADRWVAEMDKHGIERMVSIASVPGDQNSVLEAAERHPDRLIPWAMFQPTADGAREALEAAASRGLRGACLFPAMHHYMADEPEVLSFIEAASGHGLVVFVHFGILKLGIRDKLGLPSPFDLRHSNPVTLCKAAQTFPDTPFVIPHFGAGYFREALMVGRQCDNIHLDTSSSNSWIVTQPGGVTLREVMELSIDALGPERVLFGSDSNAFPRGYVAGVLETQRHAMEDAGVSAEDQARILGGNLQRLLGETARSAGSP